MDKNIPQEILATLPPRLVKDIESLSIKKAAEEIRIRTRRNTEIIFAEESALIENNPSSSEIDYILNLASKYSFYAQKEKINNGFLTIDGGHRIGFCGSAVFEDGRITALRDISSLNIRIAREIKGSADPLMPYIIQNSLPLSALIISPPSGGKTTLLRDIARQLSDGEKQKGLKVAIVDERGEIACMAGGESMLSVGKRSDVLSGCGKAQGMNMLVRSMSPQVIITDEIATLEDCAAVENAALCAVSVVASAHGISLEDLGKRASFKSLFDKKIFDLYVILEKKGSERSIGEIYEKNFKRLL